MTIRIYVTGLLVNRKIGLDTAASARDIFIQDLVCLPVKKDKREKIDERSIHTDTKAVEVNETAHTLGTRFGS